MLLPGCPVLLDRPSLRLASELRREEKFGRTMPAIYPCSSFSLLSCLSQLEGRGGVRENNCSDLAKLLRENRQNIIIRTTGTGSSFGTGPKHERNDTLHLPEGI